MPILTIEIVLKPQESLAADLARRLADAAGAIFDGPAGSVWVRLHLLPGGGYAENNPEA